jgi:hypothetical protein
MYSKTETQPMQIQQVLAVTADHTEKHHQETAIHFEQHMKGGTYAWSL